MAHACHSLWSERKGIRQVSDHRVQEARPSAPVLHRRYVKCFGDTVWDGRSLCLYTMRKRLEWEEEINEWQRPVLDDP